MCFICNINNRKIYITDATNKFQFNTHLYTNTYLNATLNVFNFVCRWKKIKYYNSARESRTIEFVATSDYPDETFCEKNQVMRDSYAIYEGTSCASDIVNQQYTHIYTHAVVEMKRFVLCPPLYHAHHLYCELITVTIKI